MNWLNLNKIKGEFSNISNLIAEGISSEPESSAEIGDPNEVEDLKKLCVMQKNEVINKKLVFFYFDYAFLH